MNILKNSNSTTYQPVANIPEELKIALQNFILCGIPQEKADSFQANLQLFINMRDKSFTDTAGRKIRDQLAEVFFESYVSVLKRVQAENNQDKIYQMFLRYAYMDERLLTAQQCNTLYNLVDQPTNNDKYSVYYLSSWLENIYSINKEPSVNEFGQDYQDMFLDKKRKRELTDKDKAAYDADIDGRLKHETDNLFKIGQRLCYG